MYVCGPILRGPAHQRASAGTREPMDSFAAFHLTVIIVGHLQAIKSVRADQRPIPACAMAIGGCHIQRTSRRGGVAAATVRLCANRSLTVHVQARDLSVQSAPQMRAHPPYAGYAGHIPHNTPASWR
jgi:hypothetical protein